MQQKIPTIKQIAQKLNISTSTVSRALRNHPSIGLRTTAQVQKLAAELNYEPDQTAIFFKQRKTFSLGVILPNLFESFFSTAINGIEDIAYGSNYNVLIGQSRDELVREEKVVETMRKHRVDGVIASISKNTTDITHFKKLNDYNIPVVFFDRVPNVKDIHSVWCSLYNSSIECVDFLVKQGHKRIGYIQGPPTLNISNERLEGYHDGHLKNNLIIDDSLIATTDFSLDSTYNAMKYLLSLKPMPSAIIAFNDYVALDAIQYFKKYKSTGKKDIQFVSYANLPITEYMYHPPIASVEQFPYEQGVQATELLLRLINSTSKEENLPYENVILKSKLVIH
jgi:DNA-binding LacI/PurR family transcriptional regulator